MVRMLTDTYYNGISYKCGEERSLDKATESRWINNKIAEATEVENPEGFFDGEKQSQPTDYSHMTDDQLAEYAESINVDISRCRSRESAEAKVRKMEPEAE